MRYFALAIFTIFALSDSARVGALGSVEAASIDLAPPSITQVKFDDKTYFPGDIISFSPKISALISDEGAVSTIEVLINSKVVYHDSPGISYNTSNKIFEYTLADKQKLKPGAYVITIEAWDASGHRSVASFQDLKVIPNPPKMGGLSISPSSFRPSDGEKVTISYQLSVNSQIRILIYNMAGDLVWSLEPKEGSTGARGGFNFINWNGKNEYGKFVTNGVYSLRFVSGNKVIGSAKIVVAD